MHVHQLMRKINSNPTCFYLQATPANSRKCNISHPDALDKHAAVEQRSTGKSRDRKSQNRKRSVCFHIWQAGYILGNIRGGCRELCALGTGQKGGKGTFPLLVSQHYLSWVVHEPVMVLYFKSGITVRLKQNLLFIQIRMIYCIKYFWKIP